MSQATYDAVNSECKLDNSQESLACQSALNDTGTEAYNGTALSPYDVLTDICESSFSAEQNLRLKKNVRRSSNPLRFLLGPLELECKRKTRLRPCYGWCSALAVVSGLEGVSCECFCWIESSNVWAEFVHISLRTFLYNVWHRSTGVSHARSQPGGLTFPLCRRTGIHLLERAGCPECSSCQQH